MSMKAVIANPDGKSPCVIYWTGQVRLHVGVVTYCDEDRNAKDGVLQVPDDAPCCVACTEAVADHRYPKARR